MDRFDDIVDNIISLEWDMFQSVNDGGPRADCQDDRKTFEGMRRGQFNAWSQEVCESYLDDLLNAMLDDRNLITEKYIHMMKYSSPRQHSILIESITMPDDETIQLARQITDILMKETELLITLYPYVAASGRPLYSISDISGIISIETYQFGELLTYSFKTLKALHQYVLKLKHEGKLLARMILENSIKFYGYQNLEEAEAKTKARIDAQGIIVSYGCEGNSSCDKPI